MYLSWRANCWEDASISQCYAAQVLSSSVIDQYTKYNSNTAVKTSELAK